MNITLQAWSEDNLLDYKIVDNIDEAILIGNKTFVLIDGVNNKLFNEDMKILVGNKEVLSMYDNYMFEFGGNYYYSPTTSDTIEFNDLKYIGKAKLVFDDIDTPHLGVHGGYEILNGSGSYNDWCKKANFIGCKSLGIIEKHTLAGIMAFQLACQENNIKSIIGETFSLDIGWNIKLYVKDKNGWANLLYLNRCINVDERKSLMLEDFKGKSEGLIAVIQYGVKLTDALIQELKSLFQDVYYQIDTVIYSNESRDNDCLIAVKHYLENYMAKIPPVLINDSYYLDSEYYHIKKKLNASAEIFHIDSKNQHFKTIDENYLILDDLFSDDDERCQYLMEVAVENANTIADSCNFTIATGVFKMPKFNTVGLSKEYQGYNHEDLIWKLIDEGLKDKSGEIEDKNEWMLRIEKEMDLITRGGYIDYFLILWDIIKWSKDNGILTGIGRGSAGGSLISYLLGITKVNPFRFGLLFERFTNEGRIGKSLPDIDVDFEGLRRNEVKRYMESKYGNRHVCSVGTYSKLRIKAALTEIRDASVDVKTIRFMTSLIKDREGGWEEIFKSSIKRSPLKEFVLNNTKLINDTRIVMDQPKTQSIHACATIILPKTDEGVKKDIYEWIPVRKAYDKDRNGMLVSEWEGQYLESAGFLKEDILGTERLDMFRHTINLIKKTDNKDIDIYSIPFDEKKVYDLFKMGYNENTFHFGTTGMKVLSKELMPNTIDDLVDMNALHRPAAMEVGSDREYLAVRFDRKEASADWGLDDVVKDTNGILLYQEQLMEAFRKLGGFTLTETDDARRSVGKKELKYILPYKDRFIQHAISIGCPPDEAAKIWHKLEVFAGYSFNKSHAAAYAITGYISQWFKAIYPLHFWTTSFEFAEDKDIPKYLSELNQISRMRGFEDKIKFMHPDINVSTGEFVTDFKEGKMYWSLQKIKEVGVVAITEILKIRDSGGKFFSITEFFKRVDCKHVNKKVIDALILSGCFDIMYDIKHPKDRIKIFNEYIKVAGHKQNMYSLIYSDVADNDYWWLYHQKMISGMGDIDYKEMAEFYKYGGKGRFLTAEDISDNRFLKSSAFIGGIIKEVEAHNMKKAKGEFANILIESNNEFIWATVWSDEWSKYGGIISHSKDKAIFINGKVKNSPFRECNVLESNEDTKIMILTFGT